MWQKYIFFATVKGNNKKKLHRNQRKFWLDTLPNARESIVETFVEKIGSKWNKLEKYF